jgi:hypothetical protein
MWNSIIKIRAPDLRFCLNQQATPAEIVGAMERFNSLPGFFPSRAQTPQK